MKMNKRDLQLLILLGLVVIGAAYYWFLFLPQQVKLTELKEQKAVLMQQHLDIDSKLTIESTLDRDLLSARELLSEAGERYYSRLIQEILLLTINELSKDTAFKINAITFTEQSAPLADIVRSFQESIIQQGGVIASNDTNAVGTVPTAAVTEGTPTDQSITYINTITALLQYEGTYTDLETFMYNLYKYPKQMVIQGVNITSDTDGFLNGVMTIEFHGLPKIGLVSEDLKAYFENGSKRASVTEVFMPYDSFVMPEVDTGLIYEEIPTDDIEIPEIPVVPQKKTVLVSSFEDFDYFFTGDNAAIVGSASRTVVRTEGNYGLKVQYNFVEPRRSNTANVVFDQRPIVIDQIGTSLSLQAYSERAIKHRIGAELIDATGKSYDVTFAMGIEGTGWQTLEIPIPDQVSYPFIVKRIFFEGTGMTQQLVAEVILDELRVVLPEIGGSQ